MAFFNQIKNKSRRLQQNPIFFWISLIFLNVLLFLPQSLFYSGSVNWFPLPPLDAPRGWYDTALFFLRRENQDLFRLVAEYFIIISLLFLAIRLWKKRWIERILIGSYIFFLLYNFYDSIMILLFGESPILYNDLMMLKGAFYLLIDISLTRKLFEISGILLLCALILALIPFLFQSVIRGLEKRRYSRKWAITFGIGWIFIIIYTFWFKFYDFRAIIHWITPKIVKNVQKSISLYTFLEKIEKKQADSTYYSYREIKLERHPDIYLFMLESYGRVLIEKQELRTPYLEFISEIEGSLNRHGWGMQSTFSRAPISGGRSWLSMGSLINGINMKDEAVYSYFINKVDNYPNLVHFLNLQGYHTFALQPLNRERPGFSMTSYERFYQYDTYINFRDLDFDGPAFGFRHIPDQYSLNHAYENFIQNADAPVFLFFLTVSSHTPWIDLPPYVADWRKLIEISRSHAAEKYAETETKIRETVSSHFTSGIGFQEYLAHIEYEIKVVRDFILNQVDENAILIITGDHQPPIITDDRSSFDVPLHIISQDTTLLSYFEEYGFGKGMFPWQQDLVIVKHEGIYSLLIRVLKQRYGYSDKENLPEYKPDGIYVFQPEQ